MLLPVKTFSSGSLRTSFPQVVREIADGHYRGILQVHEKSTVTLVSCRDEVFLSWIGSAVETSIRRISSVRAAREELSDLVSAAQDGGVVPVIFKRNEALIALMGPALLPFCESPEVEVSIYAEPRWPLNEVEKKSVTLG